MIVELSVEDLAIIRRIDVGLGGGFTALTGETGAGKSLLIDALELALGQRADAELVRAGAAKASVALTLDLSARPDVVAQLADAGVEAEEARLFLQRDVSAEGRSTCRINGRLSPVGTLRAIGRLLVDLHGQHQHQALIDAGTHLGYLDDWIGEPAHALRREVWVAYDRMRHLMAEKRALEKGVAEREHRLDLLRFQIGEIEEADPHIGEYEEAANEMLRLKNSEHLVQAVGQALAMTAEGDVSALDMMRGASKTLDGATKFDEALEPAAEAIRDSLYAVQDAVETLRDYLARLEVDPATLDAMQDRLMLLKRLRRKYGETEAEILAFAASARAELARLEDSEAALGTIEADLEEAQEGLGRLCADLSLLRRGKAELFAAEVAGQLHELSLPKARLSVSLTDKEPDGDGADAVEFLFSANAGEEPRPLAKIASGGELSRVMLGLKIALAGRAGVPTLIFDEVDTGLGGRAAATMGRKLRELGRSYQVVVISHLPQVASQADAHFRIEKTEVEGRTASGLHRLGEDERVEEVARMLSGERVGESALAAAREMVGT